MINIADAFTASDGSPKKAFIPFITVGDPTLDTTEQLVVALSEAGADLIELGIPFSDPIAEGPVIQKANVRALKHKITTDDVFAMVERLRTNGVVTPLIFMTYANIVFGYGIEHFARRAHEIGMQGIILPDVPFEEREEFEKPFADEGLALIRMIAPTSNERIAMIAREATGFVYVVSSLGVTGVRSTITSDIATMVALIRKANPHVPCAVGFGVSTPEQAEAMARLADGVITGSAIVRIIAEQGTQAVQPVFEYVRAMKQAVVRAEKDAAQR